MNFSFFPYCCVISFRHAHVLFVVVVCTAAKHVIHSFCWRIPSSCDISPNCISFFFPFVYLRFLWRQNATFAISRHYRRFDVFEEAEANKAAGKYDNVSINHQIDFYKKEGLTAYSEAKLPITSGESTFTPRIHLTARSQNFTLLSKLSADVPEGCVIIKEHIPITNLFTCLWFNEVDRFTSRDQLSFSTVRDKLMAKVSWNINMFLDCERRNFVIQVSTNENHPSST